MGANSASQWLADSAIIRFSTATSVRPRAGTIDHLKPLAKAGVPLLHVCGGADRGVPLDENRRVLEQRHKKLGGKIEVIVKPNCGHHPHGLKDLTPIVEFILKHACRVESK